MIVVNTHEAKTNLSSLLDDVLHGDEVVIARANRPIARLVPVGAPPSVRKPGCLKGKIKVSADFDAPLPADVAQGFESAE